MSAPEQKLVRVIVSGRTGSGKSLIAQTIAKALADAGVGIVFHDPGIDGPLGRTDTEVEAMLKEGAGDRIVASITEVNAPRSLPGGFDEQDDIKTIKAQIADTVRGRFGG